ncbi:MAG: signal peptide peptidase SppA [Candidatus Symbiothrix sp.]|jgi:protease-4|nr:signal peptide peptidase SppA [Candidatus Symbiothrix sp.]
MKNFLKMVFASTLGVFLAGGILFFLSFIFLIGIIASSVNSSTHELHDKSVLKINLDAVVTDRATSNPFDFLEFGGSSIEKVGLNDILSSIKKAETNAKIKGIYLEGGMLMSGYATVEPIRNALLDFKKTGKFIIAYSENYTQKAYAVCSVADTIFMNPQGVLDFRGLATSIQFNKQILEKWGIEMQVYKVGTYKSAVEPYTEQKMSDANREQVTAYLGDIWNSLLTGISESRGISVEQLNQYADECLTFVDPKKVVDYKLIDGLKYQDEVEKLLRAKVGTKEKDDLELASVKDLKSLPADRKSKSKETIAILYAEGEIVEDAVPSFLSGGESTITAKEYVKELKKLQKDDDVKAVVFRVNSPGGSAFASEQIWHAVQELRAVKPIVVSMGNVAASGGYYISAGANKIIAEPTTITGSIGIFGIIPNGAQLAKRMGATYDGVSTNKYSNFAGDVLSIPLIGLGILPARPLTDSEGAMLQAYVERGYDTFLSRCASGRNKTKEQIDAIGQGRVWTGNQALGLGLVDALGGINDAIEAAAKLADVTGYSTKDYPAEKDFFTKLLEESGNSISERVTSMFLGSERLEQKRLMNAWSHYDYRQAILLQ